MIRVSRGAELPELAAIRAKALATLRSLSGPPTSKDITGYGVAADSLWRQQHFKCCYCEQKIRRAYNDVEHHRPKARADRRPGSDETHGYWWLAFSWSNLLFACPSCNRTGKNTQFPLRHASGVLRPEDEPPGEEQPLLLDPAGPENPVDHIRFSLRSSGGSQSWWAEPRDGSIKGLWTIDVCDLNSQELRELRGDYVSGIVWPRASELLAALRQGDPAVISQAHARAVQLLGAHMSFAALAYDALVHYVDSTSIAHFDLAWPQP